MTDPSRPPNNPPTSPPNTDGVPVIPKMGTAWLAMTEDGWNLMGWSEAQQGESINGESAKAAYENLWSEGYHSMHRVMFIIPDPPKEQGHDIEAQVGKGQIPEAHE